MTKPITYLSLILWSFLPFLLDAQDPDRIKQEITATTAGQSMKIDGVLDEEAWRNAEIATDFTDETPTPNIPSDRKTEVRVLYDNASIYVGAVLYEAKDSILRQLCLRDESGQRFRGPFGNTNTDWFAVVLDNYMDGVNGVVFSVSAAGVQFDLKFSSQGPDKNWDAVWKSDVKLHDDKWVVEMEIPYSALRFPTADEQTWHINFSRVVRSKRAQSWWSPIDPNIDGLLNQSGLLKGIKDVKSPVRLQATPYLATTIEHYRHKGGDPSSRLGRSFTGGMDIKYGLNDAFTLDMTLIPNFGDVAQDDQILNLSAFEVRFDENRPFFTEGTELFNKGRLFYSRRVGGRPINFYDTYDELGDDEIITSNPIETPLINAMKLSGRTNNGLGIGVFNGITQKTFAELQDTITGATRKIETSPVVNYNVLVFDQNLKNNSFVSFINANTMRFGDDYDANSTGVVFGLNNKKRTFNINGSAKMSQIYSKSTATEGGIDADLGYAYNLSASKTGGKWQYGGFYNVESDNFNPNDLGFLRSPNERSTGVFLDFNQFEPFGAFNRAGGSVSMDYSMLHNPGYYNSFSMNLNTFWITKKFFSFGGWTNFAPIKGRDYFEPRQDDGFETYLEIPEYYAFGTWVSSDYRKKFAYDIRTRYVYTTQDNRYDIGGMISPRFRFSDQLFMVWTTNYDYESNNVGFVSYDDDNESIIGIRDVSTVVNSLNANYIFNDVMGVTLDLRHYWSKVNYESYHLLDGLGRLTDSDFDGSGNLSYNAFTIDMIYRWRFAPGSDLVFVWKNAIFTADDENTRINYFDNFKLFGDFPQTNTFNLKVVYFLDYYTIKSKLAQRKKM